MEWELPSVQTPGRGSNGLLAQACATYAAAAAHLGHAFLLADQPDPAIEHSMPPLTMASPGASSPICPC